MTIGFFAGRSTLRNLHQTVERNLLRQHRRNHARYESSPVSPASSPTQNASKVTGDKTGRPGEAFYNSFRAWIDPVKIPFRAYGRMQQRSPLLTQWESTLTIYFLGDLSAQTVQSGGFQDARYEPIRGLRALIIGGIISIPSYKWFLWLGRHFNYSSHVLSLAVKILVGQFVFTPIFNTYFFGMQSLLSGSTLTEAWERVRTTVPVSWSNSWKVWPAVTAFTFTFIQPHNRSVVAGIFAIFWQTYLSWLNRNAELEEKKTKEGEQEPAIEIPIKA